MKRFLIALSFVLSLGTTAMFAQDATVTVPPAAPTQSSNAPAPAKTAKAKKHHKKSKKKKGKKAKKS